MRGVKLERPLQITVAVTVVLGTLLFAMGQSDLQLPLIVAFAAFTSVLFTDALKWFWLPRLVANLLALLVAVHTLNNFIFADTEKKLLAIAEMLAYLELVLFYETKTARVYGHLLVLSLLQVVVAAALDFGFDGGLILAAYFVAAVAAMTLFFMHQESLRIHKLAPQAPSAKARQAQAVVGTAPVGVPTRQTGAAVRQFQDLHRLPLPWTSLINHIAALAVATITLMAVLFYSIPRHDRTIWTSPGLIEPAEVGFQPEVSFDEIAEIAQSDDLVMRVAFFDATTGKPYPLIDEPYLRGAVLTRYFSGGYERSLWRETNLGSGDEGRARNELNYGNDVVRMDVMIEPKFQLPREDDFNRSAILFSVFPVRQHSEWVYIDSQKRQLCRDFSRRHPDTERFHYSTITTAFKNGRQLLGTPYLADRDFSARARMSLHEEQLLRWYPAERLRELERLARSILNENEVDPTHAMRAALFLESHFRRSGLYTYTLDFSAIASQRDLRKDPIEEFVSKHRSGHCEYFASALALMLRSQGVPARLVVGYKGGDFNSVGNYYQVRQRHAHVWVEAYLEPYQIPGSLLPTETAAASGAWLRLDPTPPAPGLDQQADPFGLLTKARNVIDYSQVLWSDYVLRLNSQRQGEFVYAPLQAHTSEMFDQLLAATWKTTLDPTIRSSYDGNSSPRPVQRIAWSATLVAILACGCAVVIGLLRTASRRSGGRRSASLRRSNRLARWLTFWLPKWCQQRLGLAVLGRSRVDFYDGFISLLARHGIYRSVGQTAREFAATVHHRLAGSSAGRDVANLPRRIVEAYYRVRFGGAVLESHENESLARALDQLRDVLTANPK